MCSHGSVLSENFAGYRVTSQRKSTRKVGRGFYDYSQDLPKLPTPPEPAPKTELSVVLPEGGDAFAPLVNMGLISGDDDGQKPILVSPLGEDCTTVVSRLGLDPQRTVAVDFTGVDMKIVTVMCAPGGSDVLDRVVAWLNGCGLHVEVIKDSPGFVAPRIISMIVNLCCEMAQIGVGSPEDLGKAMTMGLNYPFNPLEYGDKVGGARVLTTMEGLQAVTGSERYRPSLWLRRRAKLNLSLTACD